MQSGSLGPGRPPHRHADGVVGGEDRDHSPQEEQHPAFDNVDRCVVTLAGGAGHQAASL